MINDEPQARLYRTSWPPSEEPNGFTISIGAAPRIEVEQPGFGIGIFWNRPQDKRRPFVTITLWKWVLCVGWLVDDRVGDAFEQLR